MAERENIPWGHMAGQTPTTHILEPLIGDAVRCRDALTERIVARANVGKHTHEAMHQEPGYTQIQNLGERNRVAMYQIGAQKTQPSQIEFQAYQQNRKRKSQQLCR